MRVLFLLLAVAGCAAPEVLPRPPEGYAALRVMEPVTVPGIAVPFHLPAGTVLVADRAVDGRPVYCGMALMRDFGGDRPWYTCAAREGDVIRLNVQHITSTPPFPVPPGVIEEFRLR